MSATKPRVHWVSPLPSAQTDIAHYTARILPELAAATDLTLWTDAPTWDRDLHSLARVRYLDPERIRPRDFAQAGRGQGDLGTGPEAVFVNIGNAWPFHAGFLRLVQCLPAIIVLHDMAIQELCFDAMERDLFDRATYEAAMYRWHGQPGLDGVHAVYKGEMTESDLAHRFPGFEVALPRAISVLTHTPVARDAVRVALPDLPVYLQGLPFCPGPRPADLPRSRIGGLRLVQFGYTGPNRRLQNVLEALSAVRDDVPFHLDVMGRLWDPSYIRDRINALGLSQHVTLHGFVPEPKLDAYLAAAHLVFNLRNPTMGEASGSQMRIWNAGAAAVVTDQGWYADLAAGTAFKIDAVREVPALIQLLRQLSADTEMGRATGRAGRAQLEAAHTPARYATRVAQIAAQFSADAAAVMVRGSLLSDAG